MTRRAVPCTVVQIKKCTEVSKTNAGNITPLRTGRNNEKGKEYERGIVTRFSGGLSGIGVGSPGHNT
jgi:hypothetical protein